MATLGLSEDQAKAVADMLKAVEAETSASYLAEAERRLELERERARRWWVRLGLSRSDWETIKSEVFARDGYRCAYCGTTEGEMQVDHIVPLVQGGTNDLGNLTVACQPCNSGKSGRTPEQWVRN
jgi:5-methylcytosine-specific restriction endonuclease McrA